MTYIPDEYFMEAKQIPDFWVSKYKDVSDFLLKIVKKGEIKVIGKSAGGRSIYAVSYGTARRLDEKTTFSGALAAKSISSFNGIDSSKKVYLTVAGMHGSELEGIVGIVNLISVLETGHDLRGIKWPAISQAAELLERIVIIPILNVDGRERVPQSMFPFYGKNKLIYQFWGTGAWRLNENIGHPDCKKHIPLDFKKTIFPGGYPNDNGVNIVHDDFLSEKTQPETKAFIAITRQEKADLILSMHTALNQNNYHPFLIYPYIVDQDLKYVSDFIRQVQKKLLHKVFSKRKLDNIKFTDHINSVFNINSAVYFNCGSKMITMESPCHAVSGEINGETIHYSPENLIQIQLNAHKEAMEYILKIKNKRKR